MIAWFAFFFAGVVAVALLSINNVANISLSSDIQLRDDSRTSLDRAAVALKNRLSATANSLDGISISMVPAPVQESEGMGLPLDIGVDRRLKDGRLIVYCPLSNVSEGSGLTMLNANGVQSNYSVVNGLVTGGRPTTSGDSLDGNIRAFLMVADKPGGQTPSCTAVSSLDRPSYNNVTGIITYPGAIVRTVTANMTSNIGDSINSLEQIWYVAPDGDAQADGSTFDRPTTLAVAIYELKRRKPEFARLILASGSYQAASDAFDFGDTSAGRGSVGRFSIQTEAGNQASAFVVLGSSSDISPAIVRSSSSMMLRGINIGSSARVIVADGRRLTLVNSIVGTIEADRNSHVLLENAVVTGRPNFDSVVINGSSLTVRGNVDIGLSSNRSGIVGIGGSKLFGNQGIHQTGLLRFYENNPFITGSGISAVSAISVLSGSNLNLVNMQVQTLKATSLGVLRIGSSEFETKNSVLVSSVVQPIMIDVFEGSAISLIGTQIGVTGSRPIIGLRDFGGTEFIGNTTNIRGNIGCSGTAFDGLDIGISGATGIPLTWQSSSEAVAVNSRLHINKADWICQS